MAITDSTYFNFTRIREVGPEARDWAAVDKDWNTLSLILKAFEGHHHDGSTSLTSPAFYTAAAAPTITNTGAAGTTTYSYYIVAKGPTLVPDRISAVGSTTTGNATLNGTNYNSLSWAAVTGATSYDIVRVTGGATQGKLVNQAGTTYNDQGAAATAYTPSKQPVLTESTTGGILPPGANIGVRLSYVNALGLETDACPENAITLSATASRPLTPTLTSTQVAASALAGGTYLYVLTKQKGSGETVISDPLAVTIPYDNTYSVTLGFNAISSYSDGTSAINIYRTTGLGSQFTRVGQITVSSTTSYVDNNSVNVTTQPPTVSTFDAARKVNISWAALTHPAAAAKLRVYITQQPGVYGTNCLLKEWDLTASPPTSMDYLGSETLQSGWPSNSTEIPASPPKLNLGTEATGGFTLTADSDFAGFKAKNMSVNFVPPSPADGMFWYDSTTGKFRGRQAGSSIDLAPAVTYVNELLNPSFEVALAGGLDAMTVSLGANLSVVVAPNRITTDGYNGTVSSIDATQIQASTTSATSTDAWIYYGNIATGTTGKYLVAPGERVFVRGAVKYVTNDTKAGNISMVVSFFDSTGTIIAGSPVTPGESTASQASATNTTTWYNLFGTALAPAGAAYAIVGAHLQLPAGTTSGRTYGVRMDQLMYVRAVSASGINITYFDGSSPGSYWKGTANASASVNGGFQHSRNEIGGHDASKIILGTSDVNTFLTARLANADGSQKVVTNPNYVIGTQNSGVDWTTTSTTPVDCPAMSTTVTTTVGSQWCEATFQGSFVLANAGMSATFAIEWNGTVIEETKRTITATVDNQSIALHINYNTTALFASTNTVKGKWWVSSGTVTATGTRRSLTAKAEL